MPPLQTRTRSKGTLASGQGLDLGFESFVVFEVVEGTAVTYNGLSLIGIHCCDARSFRVMFGKSEIYYGGYCVTGEVLEITYHDVDLLFSCAILVRRQAFHCVPGVSVIQFFHFEYWHRGIYCIA